MVTQPGIEPMPTAMEARSLPPGPPGKSGPPFLLFQFSSVAQSCPTLWDPMNRSTPGLPVHHQLPEFTQTHVHRVGDAIQPSHPLLFYFLLYFNFLKFIYLLIFGCAGSSLPSAGFSLIVASGGYYLVWCAGFSLQWLLLLWSTGSMARGLVCPMGMQLSSWMRDQTGEPTLAGGVLSTGPPGKSRCIIFKPWLWPIERSYHWLSVRPPAS